MEKSISTICGVKCYEENGTAYLELEAVAWGLGFTKTEIKNGKEYASVRWDRVQKYLDEMGFDHLWAKNDYIPENVFYRLAMKAKNETAEKFQAVVADQIIPSIRKHGAYITPDTLERMIADPDTTIKLLTALKEEQQKRKELESQAEANRPKVLFADAVATAKTSILIGELAKLLKQNGVKDMGQNRLFDWMRNNGYLIRRKGTDYNMPTQRSMELGLMEIKETSVSHADGYVSITKTPKITGKGQQYFINRFMK